MDTNLLIVDIILSRSISITWNPWEVNVHISLWFPKFKWPETICLDIHLAIKTILKCTGLMLTNVAYDAVIRHAPANFILVFSRATDAQRAPKRFVFAKDPLSTDWGSLVSAIYGRLFELQLPRVRLRACESRVSHHLRVRLVNSLWMRFTSVEI
jgi:hypothetical protein